MLFNSKNVNTFCKCLVILLIIMAFFCGCSARKGNIVNDTNVNVSGNICFPKYGSPICVYGDSFYYHMSVFDSIRLYKANNVDGKIKKECILSDFFSPENTSVSPDVQPTQNGVYYIKHKDDSAILYWLDISSKKSIPVLENLKIDDWVVVNDFLIYSSKSGEDFCLQMMSLDGKTQETISEKVTAFSVNNTQIRYIVQNGIGYSVFERGFKTGQKNLIGSFEVTDNDNTLFSFGDNYLVYASKCGTKLNVYSIENHSSVSCEMSGTIDLVCCSDDGVYINLVDDEKSSIYKVDLKDLNSTLIYNSKNPCISLFKNENNVYFVNSVDTEDVVYKIYNSGISEEFRH